MKRWLLVGIVLLGLVFRLAGLASHPVGFTPDEASFGYDAYSILKTGKDQWGHMLPLVFKSFGDDKLPVYTYLTIPSVFIFGLNEFSVRFPNAIFGTFAIVATYFFVRKLFNDEKLALFSSFILAISPWHIMLSRGAFEANLTTFFLPFGILLFLKGVKDRKFLFFSVLIFLLNMFTYHTARILTPVVFASLVFGYKTQLKESKRFNLSLTLAILLSLVGVLGYLFGGSRVASSGIFDLGFADDRYFAQIAGEPNLVSKIFYNKPLYVARQFVGNYISYFSPQFLATNGSAEATYGMVSGVGVIYLVELVLLLGFIVKYIMGRSKELNLILFWILISPIPAALTKGPGYAANRAAFMMPAIFIILAVGGLFIYQKLKAKGLGNFIVPSYLLLLFINFLYVGEKYLVGQKINGASPMMYGTRQLVDNISGYSDKEIVVSKNISEPQIYIAFYSKMNPVDYQNASKNWSLVNGWVDQQGEYTLGRYTFRNINYFVDAKLKNTVLVGTVGDFPIDVKANFVVSYPNQTPAYYVINQE